MIGVRLSGNGRWWEIPRIAMGQVQFGLAERRGVLRVLRSGRLRAGPLVEEFEERFARSVGARFAIAVNSGSAALYLAYRVLVESGSEVIVPDFTFVATASMAVAAGSQPAFADVDPETFTLDPADVERRITPRTRALVPVHLYGHPANIRELTRIARRHSLRVIWDAAQAHGAQFDGADVGSFPDVVCYSFYASKNMTTGEGGILTTSDASLAREFRLLRSHGEERRYHHVRIGFNFRMTELAAALGQAQLARLADFIRKRKRNAEFLTQGLQGLRCLSPPAVAPGTSHAFNLYTIRLDLEAGGISREEIQRALTRRGIETAVHYPFPLHRQPVFRDLGTDEEFPQSTRLSKTVLSLPVHPGLRQHDLTHIVRSIRQVIGSASR